MNFAWNRSIVLIGVWTLFLATLSRAQEQSAVQKSVVPSSSLTLLPPPADQDSDRDAGNDLERPLYGCACGCGIFEVGTASMLPHGAGGMVFLEYDYQDQSIDWGGVRPAPRSANSDKNIRTNFYTLGVEYFFDRSWGIEVEGQYDNRHFATVSNAPGGPVTDLQWGAFADPRFQVIYAGFFEDQSLGVSFGTKLPLGNWTHNNPYGDVDRDSELGTGCYDLLTGGFFRHQIPWNITGFVQWTVDAPLNQTQGYRPGLEADASIGAYYTGISFGNLKIVPLGQVLVSERGHDSGPAAAHPIQSGYQRLLLSPGLEFDFHPFSIYADIEVPCWQHFSGDQLTAPFLMKVILTYNF